MVIVDTAGRLGIDEELMKQASDIRDAVNPDEILFVVDAMIGQDAVRTSQAFLDGVGFDGVQGRKHGAENASHGFVCLSLFRGLV